MKIILLVLLLFTLPVLAVEEEIAELGLEEAWDFVATAEEALGEYLPDITLMEFLVSRGTEAMSPMGLLRALITFLFREVAAQARLLGQIILIAVLAAVLNQIRIGDGASDLAFGVIYLVLIYLAATSFSMALQVADTAVRQMVGVMQALVPTLAILLAALGGLATAGFLHPLMLVLITGIGTLASRILFPLIFFAAILGLVGNISGKFPISRLAGLVRQVGLVVIGFFFTVFFGVMATQGLGATVADTVGLRTIKYLTGAVIPVAGGQFAQSMELVLGSSILVKNSLGLLGLLALGLLTLFPLLKVLAILFIYKLANALVQPISDSRLVECLGSIEQSLTLLMVGLGLIALMFFLTLGLLIGVGNINVMMR